MTEIERLPFSFEGKAYEIRVVSDGNTVRISAYHGDRPANGYTYEIEIINAIDFKQQIGLDAIQKFIHLAQDDVMQKRWEKYLEAVELVRKRGA